MCGDRNLLMATRLSLMFSKKHLLEILKVESDQLIVEPAVAQHQIQIRLPEGGQTECPLDKRIFTRSVRDFFTFIPVHVKLGVYDTCTYKSNQIIKSSWYVEPS